MGIDDTRFARIEEHLIKISSDIGGIKEFMATSNRDRELLFSKISDIKEHGCVNAASHKECTELVNKHEQTFQKASGIAWLVGIGSPALSALVGWIIKKSS